MDTKKAFDEQLMQEPQRIIAALEALQRERVVRSIYLILSITVCRLSFLCSLLCGLSGIIKLDQNVAYNLVQFHFLVILLPFSISYPLINFNEQQHPEADSWTMTDHVGYLTRSEEHTSELQSR